MKMTVTALSVSALLLAGCMGNTAAAPGLGSAIVQAGGTQAASAVVGASGSGGNEITAGVQQAVLQSSGSVSTGSRRGTNVYTSSYVGYSCEQLADLIESLEPSQVATTASTGLSTVASLAGLFGNRNAASGASTLLNAQSSVSEQQVLQMEAAQGVAESKGC